jgi:hypothetical protein
MSLNTNDLTCKKRNIILIIIIVITTISSLLFTYNFYKEADIVKTRDNLPSPNYTITYHKSSNVDIVRFQFQTNCRAAVFDHILDEKEYNNGEPKPRLEDGVLINDVKTGGGICLMEEADRMNLIMQKEERTSICIADTLRSFVDL